MEELLLGRLLTDGHLTLVPTQQMNHRLSNLTVINRLLLFCPRFMVFGMLL
ncbi:KH domain containing, RNA binding, signal transduction associated 3, isoform CRA_c [Rattus norvegicus]|uniref:KH domain containing, RNA binding, signal transduction associated 3, isoform CRA_c n=1 Tax=Rattus norvegicus TaxID=10116 RepID=A6HRU1_RAT|nr:KH domain containing, RNA binding, signal transduction associated 3, isoform CRA_c [Rattus norvegicus]